MINMAQQANSLDLIPTPLEAPHSEQVGLGVSRISVLLSEGVGAVQVEWVTLATCSSNCLGPLVAEVDGEAHLAVWEVQEGLEHPLEART
jgi:hypothetical protein